MKSFLCYLCLIMFIMLCVISVLKIFPANNGVWYMEMEMESGQHAGKGFWKLPRAICKTSGLLGCCLNFEKSEGWKSQVCEPNP